MTPAAIEAWARRGTAGDMLALARIVECLDSASRRTLRRCAVEAVAKQWRRQIDEPTSDGQAPADSLAIAIVVLDNYSALGVDGKSRVLETAVMLLATMRLLSSNFPAGTWEGEYQWLNALARETYPHYDVVADLLGELRGWLLDWEEVVCPDGPGGNVTIPAEREIDTAEGMLTGYETTRDNQGAYGPPEAAEYLGIEVPTIDFKDWDGDELVLDKARWRAAVRDATVLRLAEFVADWKASFLDALITGQQPVEVPERECASTTPAASVGDLDDIDVEKLLDEIERGVVTGPGLDDIPELQPILEELDKIMGRDSPQVDPSAPTTALPPHSP